MELAAIHGRIGKLNCRISRVKKNTGTAPVCSRDWVYRSSQKVDGVNVLFLLDYRSI